MNYSFFQHRTNQHGAALIVSLIILVVVTLIGLSSIQISTQEERMSAHSFDRSMGFQGAEAALREGEKRADLGTSFPTTTCECNDDGLCAPPNDTCQERWLLESTTWKEISDDVGLGDRAMKPAYIVEYLGDFYPCDWDLTSENNECKRYRITARSFKPDADDASSGRADVMLQSIYAPKVE